MASLPAVLIFGEAENAPLSLVSIRVFMATLHVSCNMVCRTPMIRFLSGRSRLPSSHPERLKGLKNAEYLRSRKAPVAQPGRAAVSYAQGNLDRTNSRSWVRFPSGAPPLLVTNPSIEGFEKGSAPKRASADCGRRSGHLAVTPVAHPPSGGVLKRLQESPDDDVLWAFGSP